MKNWIGNKNSIYSPLGASNHSDYERSENDFYATSPKAIDDLLKILGSDLSCSVWEIACGNGHLSKRLKELRPDLKIYNSDIIKRDFECREINFLNYDNPNSFDGDIITNPPYKYAREFVEKSIETVTTGHFVCMFLKLTFLEGQRRKEMFKKFPPKIVAVYSRRMQVARNGESKMFKKSSAICYAWFIWQKGSINVPIIKWI